MADAQFLCGVAEGFYGRPWTTAQRRQLFLWMAAWGLNTYLYAPKDDLKHRLLWRELYSESEAAGLKAVLDESHRHGLKFIYALAPGLDPDYSSAAGVAALGRKVGQLQELGCCHFSLLFDDIVPMTAAVLLGAGAVEAQTQAQFANVLFADLRARLPDSTLLFCPTPYCGRMAGPVMRSDYLLELGRRLHPAIPVFWTGPEIVSEAITPESIRELAGVLQRRPVIWDNLHANDYDLRRIYLGPYSGRPLELRAEVGGVLINPNCEFEANFIPVGTFGMWTKAVEQWEPREAYQAALRQWLPMWKSMISPAEVEAPAYLSEANPKLAEAAPWMRLPTNINLAFLELLGDCFYLPFEHGPRARELLAELQHLLRTPPSAWQESFGRVGQICRSTRTMFEAMTALENRELLYALYRQVWELKEELSLVENYLGWLRSKPGLGDAFTSAEHRPKAYRGGLVAELQRLLPMSAAGEFTHRPSLIPQHDPNPYR